jgi:hypothetical protein
MNGATNILKLQGMITTAENVPISEALFPFIAIQAGIPKKVIPSGIPCATYRMAKLMYLTKVFSESEGRPLLFTVDLEVPDSIAVMLWI